MMGYNTMIATLETAPIWAKELQRIVATAFPQGITAELYWPIISALGREMSYRSVARHLALVCDKSYPVLYHDAMTADSRPMCDPDEAERVWALLNNQGFTAWLDSP
jgi:hypothetical protein